MEELLPAHCGHKKASGNNGRKKPGDDNCQQSRCRMSAAVWPDYADSAPIPAITN
jgi:hypothetical protein